MMLGRGCTQTRVKALSHGQYIEVSRRQNVLRLIYVIFGHSMKRPLKMDIVLVMRCLLAHLMEKTQVVPLLFFQTESPIITSDALFISVYVLRKPLNDPYHSVSLLFSITVPL